MDTIIVTTPTGIELIVPYVPTQRDGSIINGVT